MLETMENIDAMLRGNRKMLLIHCGIACVQASLFGYYFSGFFTASWLRWFAVVPAVSALVAVHYVRYHVSARKTLLQYRRAIQRHMKENGYE